MIWSTFLIDADARAGLPVVSDRLTVLDVFDT